MQSFIAIAHSYQKLYRGAESAPPPPPSQKSSKKPILNRVKETQNSNIVDFLAKILEEWLLFSLDMATNQL